MISVNLSLKLPYIYASTRFLSSDFFAPLASNITTDILILYSLTGIQILLVIFIVKLIYKVMIFQISGARLCPYSVLTFPPEYFTVRTPMTSTFKNTSTMIGYQGRSKTKLTLRLVWSLHKPTQHCLQIPYKEREQPILAVVLISDSVYLQDQLKAWSVVKRQVEVYLMEYKSKYDSSMIVKMIELACQLV